MTNQNSQELKICPVCAYESFEKWIGCDCNYGENFDAWRCATIKANSRAETKPSDRRKEVCELAEKILIGSLSHTPNSDGNGLKCVSAPNEKCFDLAEKFIEARDAYLKGSET